LPKILLVRHGITESNRARKLTGQCDVDLSADGYRQVEQLRDRLLGEKIDSVYSSDLRRAVATAEVISSGHELNIIRCPELREINYGKAEGLTFEEIGRLYPDVAELVKNFSLQLEFPEGESFEGFAARTSSFLDKLQEYAPSQTMLVVSHSGPLRVLVCRLLGIDLGHWRQFRLDFASLSILETYPQATIVNLLNDTSHLDRVNGKSQT
jgi:alpha-ribazole phosphatase